MDCATHHMFGIAASAKDLEAQGWRVHQLHQCVFLYYGGNELIGVCGVYVDDFIIAGKTHNPKWEAVKAKLLSL